METADWGGILALVFMGALMLGCWMGRLVGRYGLRLVRGCRVDQQRMQLQMLVERPNRERVWVDAAGEHGVAWKQPHYTEEG